MGIGNRDPPPVTVFPGHRLARTQHLGLLEPPRGIAAGDAQCRGQHLLPRGLTEAVRFGLGEQPLDQPVLECGQRTGH